MATAKKDFAVYAEAPPVHNLAVKSEVVPASLAAQRKEVLAGGVTKIENVVDLSRNRHEKEGPSFFVLVSETSLFAGQPNIAGAIDGPAHVAKFNTPSDIVVDKNQQLFIADTDNARIRRISKQGMVSTVAAIGGGDGDIENFPHGLAFDHNGAMYILQSGLKHQIFQVAPGAGVRLIAGTEGRGFTDTTTDMLQASFNHPRATGVDSKNRIYICDKGNNAIRRLDMEKGTVITIMGPDGEPLDLLNPEGIVVDQYDDVFVADTGHHRIMKIVFVINPRTGNEEVVVSNYCGKYDAPGYANGPANESLLNTPTGLAIDKTNHLWICDSGNNCIRMMAHGAELMFTVSGKGSVEQEKQYNYPTSIALSYDAMYGATMSDAAPDVVRTDPTHPLYYSYITPVVFVADSGSHCIRKIHTIAIEGAKALIDVCTPPSNVNAEDDFPMHNALSYGITTQRNGLMSVLLQLKPHLLQQRDKEGRIPLHIACMESKTSTAGTIAPYIIEKMLGQAEPDAVSSILTADQKGRIPLSYALECIQEHALNVAMEKAERGEDDEPDVDNPDLPWDASRQLMVPMLALAPQALQHPSCQHFTLHTLIAAAVPLKFLKKYTQAIEDAREQAIADGMFDANFTTMFSLKQECLKQFPNPFFVRDDAGRLPIHVATQMHASGTPVALDVLQWLVLVSQLPPQLPNTPPSVQIRDLSLKNVITKGRGNEEVEGHFPMFYLCTVPRAAAPNAPPGGPQLHKPIHKLNAEQKAAIEYMLDAWPNSILQNEAAGVLHSSPFQNTSMKPATFLEWVFYHRSLELLEIFCRKMPNCLDRFVWIDTLDVLSPAESAASEIGKDGRRKRRHSAGPNTLTMLHSAAKINDAELLEVLLKNHANPFLSDKRDRLPIDLTTDNKCRDLIQGYMDRDARKPIVPTVTTEIACQTDEDQQAMADKAKLAEEAKRLTALQAEMAAKLAAEEAARKKADEDRARAEAERAKAEADRLKAEEEAARRAKQLEEEKARMAAEAEADAARRAKELEEEKARLAAEIEAEKARLAALDAEREAARQAAEAAAEEERQRLAAEAEAERQRLAELDADREAAKKALEEEMRAAAEAEKAQMEELRARLAQEAEEEKARLAAEAEEERQRLAALDAEREAARLALEAELRAAAEEEKARLAAEAEAERQRLAELDAEREAARKRQEEELAAADAAREEARRKMEEEARLAEEARQAAQRQLEEELRLSAEAERARLAAELDAEKARLAALDAEREAAKAAREEELRRLEEEAAARERERQAHNQQLEGQRDAARSAAEEAEAARLAAEEEARKLREELDRLAREKAAADAAAAAAEAARLAAEADAEEARRRREHQWNLNAEHEERLRKEQEAALANAPPPPTNEPKAGAPKKKQSAAELAALARAQAAIEAAAAKRNAPKKVLGFGSSALKTDVAAAGPAK